MPVVEVVRIPEHDLPGEAALEFRDPLLDHQQASVRRVQAGGGSGQEVLRFPGNFDPAEAEAHLAGWLRRRWHGRESVSFAVAAARRDLEPGSVIRVPAVAGGSDYVVTSVEEGLTRQVAATRIVRLPPFSQRPALRATVLPAPTVAGKPYAVFLDLPMMPGAAAEADQFRVAVWARPWRTQVLFASPEETGFSQRATTLQKAVLGELRAALPPGAEGRVQTAHALTVKLNGGALASVSRLQMLNGANAAAVLAANGVWEVLQFEAAEEIAPDEWRLTGLLRGQLGTGDAMAAGAAQGAAFALLDEAVRPAGLKRAEAGILLNWRTGPSGYDFTGENFDAQTVAGGLRALTPLSPVHLRARRTAAGDLAVSWIRRGRIDADSWLAAEIPLGEEREAYAVTVAMTDGTAVRTLEVSESAWTYSAGQIAVDFPAGGEADLTVRQLSAAVGPGFPAALRLQI
jgi:hypothetical protein